jgi:hypothetical protein
MNCRLMMRMLDLIGQPLQEAIERAELLVRYWIEQHHQASLKSKRGPGVR